MDFNHKFNYWKNSLLDLGKRNKLINFKETKRSVVTITYPDIYTLWDRIVKKEEKLKFPKILDSFDENEEINDNNNEDECYNYSEEEIKTNQTIRELQKTLRNIKSKAKISKEELGINTLYLGFLFLKWNEREDSEVEFESPLILVPVEIESENLQSPFTLSILQDDDIIINPALAYKLNSDFGIDINQEMQEINLKEYLNAINNKIKNTKWKIEEKTSLSLFSFYKISMYNDLISNKEKIKNSQVMQLIMGNSECIQEIPEKLNTIDFDKDIKVKDSFQIIDADSSQLDAIEYAKNGISFILQGPPGTGKSQTITNIIAELLAKGKKILFVSSKRAALEVVYKRLQKANLEKFCLSLHDPKTNKKEILKQLESVLNLAHSKYTITEQADYDLEKLQTIKDKINNYNKELHEIQKPFNRSIYQINGEISKLEEFKDLIFSFKNINKISKDDFNAILYSLEEYVRTIGSNTQYWKTSCWYGVKKIELNNEMRHDIGFHLENLYNKLTIFNNELMKIQNDLYIKFEITEDNYAKIVNLLKKLKKIQSVPDQWFNEENLYNLLKKLKYQKVIASKINSLKDEINNINTKYNVIDLSDNYYNTLNQLEKLKNSEDLFIKLQSIDEIEQHKLLDDLRNFINSYNSIKNKLFLDYEKEILDINYKEILKRFKSEYNSPLKIFNKNYKLDKKIFLELRKEVSKKISDNEMLNTLYLLNDIEKLKECNVDNIKKWKEILCNYFQGFNTNIDIIIEKFEKYNILVNIERKIKSIIDFSKETLDEVELKKVIGYTYDSSYINWNEIIECLELFIEINNECNELKIDNNIIRAIYNQKDIEDKLDELINLLLINYNNINIEKKWFKELFENNDFLTKMTSLELAQKVLECKKNSDILERYLDYKVAKEHCIHLGLEDFILKIEKENITNNDIIPIFKKRFYRLWLDFAEQNCNEIKNFRRDVYESDINEFKKLDKKQYNINQLRIFQKIVSSFPNFDRLTNGNDEISILKRELNKNRRTMPLRKLFSSISNLILTLKPCIMMSPLSVSIFLDSSKYMFDTVIFDEASQVKTEDAIGAIIRGKQVIIVGDKKQLPPTNFFNITNTEFEDFDEEYDDTGAYESIIDEANLLPEKTLLWHYRSKNEALITFSNIKFYDNKLITFPSNCEKRINNGVEFYYVENGSYDRGGRKGNILEAKKVAEMVFKHFEENPERSLGVIAFGEIQQYAIENEINKLRLNNSSFETFFSEDKENAFFVKNLENVQGDERDTIIFSIGYAKDNNGKMNMNFGPLSRIGGERRLNVAITRAKYNIKLVSSILPNEIDCDRINTIGPKLLKKYIEYAKDGMSVLQNEITVNESNYFDSPFEESVYNFLIKNGYDVCTQVGSSGYRIDMAVKHPKNKDIFSIGIECDGATYHSTRTARERDRLRQEILENMGWKIYRIWSTDWIKNQEKESKKLLQAIENSISSTEFEKKNYNLENSNNLEYISITEKDTFDKENPYGLDIYVKYNFDYDKCKNMPIEKILDDVIKVEYPIHFDEICKRVSMYYLCTSASKKVKENVYIALLNIKNNYIVDENFYMPRDAEIRARCNLEYNNSYGKTYLKIGNCKLYNNCKDIKFFTFKRPFKYIYKKELALIMKKISEKSINISPQSLFEETAKVLNTRVANNYEKFVEAYKLINL